MNETTATGEVNGNVNAKRLDVLDRWLERVSASVAWTGKTDVGAVTAYLINGDIMFVVRFDTGGWDMFVPASKSPGIADTLDRAAMFLGVDGCRGLVEDGQAIANDSVRESLAVADHVCDKCGHRWVDDVIPYAEPCCPMNGCSGFGKLPRGSQGDSECEGAYLSSE